MKNISDKKLLALCTKYGNRALYWRQKFIGLLPEANRRRLYEKKGYGSIFEFGKRMAGLSEAQIRLALNLEKRFEDKPVLKSMLVDGKVSINKLARVVSIATISNESVLAASAEQLSNRSLEVLVRDIKREGVLSRVSGRGFGSGDVISGSFVRSTSRGLTQNVNSETTSNISQKTLDLQIQNGLFEPKIKAKSLHVQDDKVASYAQKLQEISLKKVKLKLSEDTINHLLELQEKGIDIDKIVRGGFIKRNKDLAMRKSENAKAVVGKEEGRRKEGKPPVRYLGVETKRILEEEFGTKCAVPACLKNSEHIHHTARFGLTGSNNPHFLAPLCKEHHDIAHIMDKKFIKKKMG